jgi:pentapeptide MXKDX repeat protein
VQAVPPRIVLTGCDASLQENVICGNNRRPESVEGKAADVAVRDQPRRMTTPMTTTRFGLGVSAALVSLSLAFAPAAFAQDKMGKDDSMKKDTMAKDAMKRDDGMKKDDAMKKGDAMSKDAMKKDDGMKKH